MEDVSPLIDHKLFLLLTITALLPSNAGTTKPPQLVTKLIHRDSIFSPYYNPNITISERVRRATKSSRNRYSYLKARAKSPSTMDDVDDDDDDIRGSLQPEHIGVYGGSIDFLIRFSIGWPPIPQLAVMDTGSNLLWLQCRPCPGCFNQSTRMFDPSSSSTYTNLPCNSTYCENCDSTRNCTFYRAYHDGTIASGYLGLEELMFNTSDGSTNSVPSVVFGCSHDNNLNGQANGILGLGPEKKSIASQLGSKFSYCIGSIDDYQYEYNQLIMGDGAKIEGYSTPMEVFRNHYYLTLEGISVGEKMLNIDPEVFERFLTGEGGVVIDSGSTVTHLVGEGFDALSKEVQSLIGSTLRKVVEWDDEDRLCYNGTMSRDLKGFPAVTFHFGGGAELVLGVEALFEPHEVAEFCMAVERSGDSPDLTVIGIRAQQFYNVGYDLAAMKLYFQRIDCELLED